MVQWPYSRDPQDACAPALDLLQDFVQNKKTPEGLKCRQVGAAGMACAGCEPASPAYAVSACWPQSDHCHAHLLQLVPTSGGTSTSLWDATSADDLKQWLDEVWRSGWHVCASRGKGAWVSYVNAAADRSARGWPPDTPAHLLIHSLLCSPSMWM